MSDRLLLIGWDAADWRILHPLIDSGKMPTLNRLVEAGVSGPLLCAQPAVPTMLWTSIATGKRAWQHGVCHSSELAKNSSRKVSITAGRRRSAALWQMLAHEGKRCLVVGWPATHNEHVGHSIIVSDRFPEPTAGPGIKPWPPAAPGTYWPPELNTLLDPKRVSPEEIGSNVISQYVPAWQQIDQKRDHRLGHLRVFLAADYSYQTATMALMQEEEWDFAAVRFPAPSPISRMFMPHHLSQGSGANDEFELYRNVLRAACQILDIMLHQLVELAGPDTAVMVVSGHGVRTHNVPARGFPPGDNESWQSPYGIFAASGPKFSCDALVHGAGVLDVAPTVLTWFGLPIGEDMEGRVLVESFETFPEIARVESWESRLKNPPRPTEEIPVSPGNLPEAVLQGESDWNFVLSCLEASRYKEALPVLERMFREFPERAELGHALFQCQLAMGCLAEAADTLEVTLESIPPGAASLLPRAELALAQGNIKLARALVIETRKCNPTHPVAMRKLGLLLLRLRQWDALAEVASQALRMDEQEPIAWLGLAEAELRKGNAPEAEEAAMRAIGLKYFLPDAHFVLTRALVAQGKWREARDAMQTLLKLQPDNRAAANYFKRMPRESDHPNGPK
jgi:predicted AlkP superfamily phosphohydrolase/phosphomutase